MQKISDMSFFGKLFTLVMPNDKNVLESLKKDIVEVEGENIFKQEEDFNLLFSPREQKYYLFNEEVTKACSENFKFDKLNFSLFVDKLEKYKVYNIVAVYDKKMAAEVFYRFFINDKEQICVLLGYCKGAGKVMRFHQVVIDCANSNIGLASKTSNIQLEFEIAGKCINFLFTILSFLFFADIKEKLIAPKIKIKLNFYKELLNDTGRDFIYVTPNWNTVSIRTEGFLKFPVILHLGGMVLVEVV